jgi:4-hydroxybenzoate polyprenyltransferase
VVAAQPDSVITVTAGTAGAPPASAAARLSALLAAAHGPPALAVTVLAGLLSVAAGHDATTDLLVVAAVLSGQLSIGWSNDLIDLGRDRAVGRTDKPLVTGALPVAWVRTACAVAVVATVPFSLACGVGAGLAHLVCVAAGWAYNLGLKRTWWSWLPYAVAFGALPAFVSLAGPDGETPPWWWPVAGALLGVGAHLLNVLPDLADDAATDVRGFPHRLGPRRIPAVAAAVLLTASAAILVGAGVPLVLALLTALVLLALGTVVVTRTGKVPFAAAVGIALVDVVLLVAAR